MFLYSDSSSLSLISLRGHEYISLSDPNSTRFFPGLMMKRNIEKGQEKMHMIVLVILMITLVVVIVI